MPIWTPPVLLDERAPLQPDELVRSGDRFARATLKGIQRLVETSQLPSTSPAFPLGRYARNLNAGQGTYEAPGQPARGDSVQIDAPYATFVRPFDGDTKRAPLNEFCQVGADGPIGEHGRLFSTVSPGGFVYVQSVLKADDNDRVSSWATTTLDIYYQFAAGWNAGNTYFGPWTWNRYGADSHLENLIQYGDTITQCKQARPVAVTPIAAGQYHSGSPWSEIDISGKLPPETYAVQIIAGCSTPGSVVAIAPSPGFTLHGEGGAFAPMILSGAESRTEWLLMDSYNPLKIYVYSTDDTFIAHVLAIKVRFA